ncbi:hypothetical protein ACH5RR_036118 [Cinchona calisaya]|uniref:Uncharacterized protein n=1 Tax=Cinchona calisaya TaxID=153742 RepID=A0ABD2Y5V1_9GENT
MDGNENKAEDMAIMLSDLQQKMKPIAAELLDLYLKAMKSNTKYSKGFLAERFAEVPRPTKYCPLASIFWWIASIFSTPPVDHAKDAVEILYEGLSLLIKFLLDITPDKHESVEDVELELISSDIKKVTSEAGSLKYSSSQGSDYRLTLLQLLQKIEILKVEVILMQLADSSLERNANRPLKEQFESVHKGVAFLRTFLEYLQMFSGKQKMVYTQIKATVREADFVYQSWLAGDVTEDRVRNAVKLLVDVRLLKTEAFLMELVVKCEPCRLSSEYQIEMLHEELALLRKFISGTPKENRSDANQLILKHIEGVAKEAVSLCCSFNSDMASENMIKEFLSNLLENGNPSKQRLKIFISNFDAHHRLFSQRLGD